MDGSTEDLGALEALVQQEYPRLVRSVALLCGAPRVAEDAVGEALARAWVEIRGGEPISNLAGWIVVVGANVARDWLRREGAEQRAVNRLSLAVGVSHEQGGPELAAESAALWAAVDVLPQRQREVAVLRYGLG